MFLAPRPAVFLLLLPPPAVGSFDVCVDDDGDGDGAHYVAANSFYSFSACDEGDAAAPRRGHGDAAQEKKKSGDDEVVVMLASAEALARAIGRSRDVER